MAEITRRRNGEMSRGIFQILMEEHEGIPASTVLERLQRVVPPTDFEKQDYPNRPGVRRYEKTARFSTITSVKAGWLVKERGRWYLTEEGRKAFRSLTDPELFYRESIKGYEAWVDGQAGTKLQEVIPTEEGEETVLAPRTRLSIFEEAEESAWKDIQDYLANVNPHKLQDVIAALLRAMGYHVSWISPPGRDGGIDLVAHTDPLGAGPRIKVQVKRRGDRIDVEGLRSFLALLGDQDVGIFVAIGGFTQDAVREARTQERRRITLVDGEKFYDLWVEHHDKIPDGDRKLFQIKPVYYLVPGD